MLDLALGAQTSAVRGLFLVSPDGREEDVRAQIRRPPFSACALRGLRDTGRPAVHAALSYLVVGPVVAWVLARALGLGVIGIWLGLAAALATVTVLLALRLLRLTRGR